MTKENKKFTRRGILGIDTFIDKSSPKTEEKIKQEKEDQISQARKKADDTLGTGDFAQAVKDYRKCLDISCKQADTRRLMIYALYRQGKYIQAKVECRRLIKDHGPDESTATMFGLCHLRLGQGDKAIDLWTETEFSDNSPVKKKLAANIQGIRQGDKNIVEQIVACIEEHIPHLPGFDLLANTAHLTATIWIYPVATGCNMITAHWSGKTLPHYTHHLTSAIIHELKFSAFWRNTIFTLLKGADYRLFGYLFRQFQSQVEETIQGKRSFAWLRPINLLKENHSK